MFLQLSPFALFLPLFPIADLRERHIPNRLLLLALLPGMTTQNPYFLLCLYLSALLFYPWFRLYLIGVGDVKLLGLCCVYLGLFTSLGFFFPGLLAATLPTL